MFLTTTLLSLGQSDDDELPPQPPSAASPTLDPSVNTIVNIPPSFPGGPASLKNFISEKVKAINPKLSGTIYFRVIIGEDGQLTNPQLVKNTSSCANCEKEAIKIFNAMPKWTPGELNGKKVKTYYNITISFDN